MHDPASQAAVKGALHRLGWYLLWLIVGLAVVAFGSCAGWAS